MVDILQITDSNTLLFNIGFCILINISQKFIPDDTTKSALVQMFALAPIRLQAIIWTNDDQVLWCHMASLGHNELKVERVNSVNKPASVCMADSHVWLPSLRKHLNRCTHVPLHSTIARQHCYSYYTDILYYL